MTSTVDLPAVEGELVEYRSPEEWGAIIRADLGRSVQGVIDAGMHLVEAKKQIDRHGEWLPWIARELPVGASTVDKMMALTKNKAITNSDHGPNLPSSWRTLYELSRLEPPQLEAAIADGEVTPALERKAAKAVVARYRIGVEPPSPAPASIDGEVGTIVADPPWRYGNTSTRGAAEDHYPTMSIDEIAELKVAHEHTGERAHLYLWTTAGHLPEAFTIMEAWGFTYKTYLVWVKPQMGMGNYFRVSTELVLFGIKGDLRTQDRAIMNWFEARRGKHSAKPESFYDMVMKASPGPYLEMFARCRKSRQLICGCAKCRLGWQVWGNES